MPGICDNLFDAVDICQRCCLEESGQRLNFVGRTYFALAPKSSNANLAICLTVWTASQPFCLLLLSRWFRNDLQKTIFLNWKRSSLESLLWWKNRASVRFSKSLKIQNWTFPVRCFRRCKSRDPTSSFWITFRTLPAVTSSDTSGSGTSSRSWSSSW